MHGEPNALILLAVLALSGLLTWVRVRRLGQTAGSGWRALADGLGLTRVARTPLSGARMEGVRSDVWVVVEEVAGDPSRPEGHHGGEWIRATVTAAIPEGLLVRSAHREVAKGLPLGDREFDAQVELQGPEALALALMDNESRHGALRQCLEDGFVLSGTALRLDVTTAVRKHKVQQTIARVERMIAAMSHLQVKARDLTASLAENARTDPLPEVRRRNLKALADRGEATADARAAGAAFLGDADPATRLLGARLEGGPAGMRALEEILRDGSLKPALRAEALQWLAKLESRPAALAFARDGLAAEVPEIRCEAIRALGALKDEGSFERIRDLAADPAYSAAAAEAFATMGDSRGQEVLVRLLAHEDWRTQMAAARGLQELGTVDAVAPLMETERRAGSAVKEACVAAVHAIQARLGDVDSGRLSLADAPERIGAVSLAPAGGELSVAPQDPAPPKPQGSRS